MATPPIKSFNAYCPECDARITLRKEPELGQRLVCPECDEPLEVVELDPLELDWAYDEDEDEEEAWDDWDQDDDGW